LERARVTDARLKLAKDLTPGDRALIGVKPRETEAVAVLAVVPSVQTIRRKVVLVTFRTTDGRDFHRTYSEHSAVRMAQP
jgi:hypothetical protein